MTCCSVIYAPAVLSPPVNSCRVGYRVGEQDIGLDPKGHTKGMNGPVPYWHIADIHTGLQRLVAAGATVRQGINDVGEGKLVATVNDADGNLIGLIQLA